MLAVAIEERHPLERQAPPVDARLAQAELARRGQLLLVVALAPAHHRREQRHALPAELAAEPGQDLAPCLRADRRAAAGAVLDAELGEQQAEVVVDLGDGGDRRGAAAAREALLDGDRGRQPGEQIEVRLRHHVQELARVGGQAVDVAPLALGVQHVEGERGLARAGEPGEHDQPVARQLEGEVAQVVCARAHQADVAVPPGGRRGVHGRRVGDP